MKNTIVTLAVSLSLLVATQSVNAQIVQNIPNPPVSGEPLKNCIRRSSAPLNRTLDKIPAHTRNTSQKAIKVRQKWVKDVTQCVSNINK